MKRSAVTVKVLPLATLPLRSRCDGGIDTGAPASQKPSTAPTANPPGITLTSTDAPGASGLAHERTCAPFTTSETTSYWLLLTTRTRVGAGGGGGSGTTKSAGLSAKLPSASEKRTRPVAAPAGTVTASSVADTSCGLTAATRAPPAPAKVTAYPTPSERRPVRLRSSAVPRIVMRVPAVALDGVKPVMVGRATWSWRPPRLPAVLTGATA